MFDPKEAEEVCERLKTYLNLLTKVKTMLDRGYPIGLGWWRGRVKIWCKIELEQCGMHWTIAGAEAVLRLRYIQINGMTGDCWKYHVAQERQRLYRDFVEDGSVELAA